MASYYGIYFILHFAILPLKIIPIPNVGKILVHVNECSQHQCLSICNYRVLHMSPFMNLGQNLLMNCVKMSFNSSPGLLHHPIVLCFSISPLIFAVSSWVSEYFIYCLPLYFNHYTLSDHVVSDHGHVMMIVCHWLINICAYVVSRLYTFLDFQVRFEILKINSYTNS